MITNSVYIKEPDIAVICKDSCQPVLVCKMADIIWVTNPRYVVDNEPFVALVKAMSNEEAAYTKWLYLIGKMSRKDTSSKYFSNPVTTEHFSNGDDVSGTLRKVIVTKTLEYWELVKQELQL